MSYCAPHDEELLPKMSDPLSSRAVKYVLKKILFWILIFFIVFWILGWFVSDTDWTKYEQASIDLGSLDNKHEFIRTPLVWLLVVAAVIIICLLLKVDQFTNKNTSHDLESWNWLFLIFALIVLFIGWWILCATSTLTGERVAALGAILVSSWFGVYSMVRVRASLKLGTNTALTFAIIFYPFVFFVFLLFILKVHWGVIVAVIVIAIIINIVTCEAYLFQKRMRGGFWLTLIICFLVVGFLFWILGKFVAFPFSIVWYIIVFVIVFLFCFYLKKTPVEE
ncbi:hypothetical protein P9112_005879 [Eukaryota sp. TZLM1-RC]